MLAKRPVETNAVVDNHVCVLPNAGVGAVVAHNGLNTARDSRGPIGSRCTPLPQRHQQHHQRGGLVVRARLDRRHYPTGKKISAKEFQALQIERDAFHGDWNYCIRPRAQER